MTKKKTYVNVIIILSWDNKRSVKVLLLLLHQFKTVVNNIIVITSLLKVLREFPVICTAHNLQSIF